MKEMKLQIWLRDFEKTGDFCPCHVKIEDLTSKHPETEVLHFQVSAGGDTIDSVYADTLELIGQRFDHYFKTPK
jgi:hypothetical protein